MITEIEQRLLSCNGDKFANLCRLYLSYRYEIVNSTGFVLGKEKSKKGTPDTFIPVKDFYIFNEITTTDRKRLIPKLKKDIEHCFKQKDINADKIAKIILICNSKISVLDQEVLNEHKNTINSTVDLEVIGIDVLATAIFKDYPSIGKELGVPIDTGQILQSNDFIAQYEKSKFSTPLSNLFFNREKEIEEGIALLEKEDFLILSGSAGVGKTKLSLELVQKFVYKYDDYKIKYIRANGILTIWDDLKIQLIKDNNYLIVVDDANKLKSNLDLIINFKNDFEHGNIKLLFTVRNYVKEEIQNKLKNYNIIELKPFNKEELKTILKSSDFNISEFYSEKIYSISKGNPRIAIMAAIAGINGDMEKLKNAALILDEYFSSVNEQLNVDYNLIKTAGILSLFRTIDFSNDEIIEQIENYFDISKNELLENLTLLFKYEIADEFNNSYKIADQILGEYLFYLVFIKQKRISFSLLLDLYIDKQKVSLPKLLFPIISNYGFEDVKNLIINDLKTKWNALKDTNTSLKFLNDFWFYLPTESLMFVDSLIKEQDAVDVETFTFGIFESNQIEFYDDIIIEILRSFRQNIDMFPIALDVLVKYCTGDPIRFTKLMKVFTQSFIYNRFDYAISYRIQIILFEYLYNKAQTENYYFYSRIILFIASKYLAASQQTSKWDGDMVYSGHIMINLSKEQKDFRLNLWNFIFSCYQHDILKDYVLDFFMLHKYDFFYLNDNSVVNYDKKLILNFFNTFLPNPSFKEAKVVYKYLKRLDSQKIPYPKFLKTKFKNKEFDLYCLLDQRKTENRDSLDLYIEGFGLRDFRKLFLTINIISGYEKAKFLGHSVVLDSISYILIKLQKIDFKQFLKVIELIFQYDYSGGLSLGLIFKDIAYNKSKSDKLRSLIVEKKIAIGCIIPFLTSLPTKFVITKDYEMFILYLRDGKTVWINFIEDIFEKFKNLDIECEKELNNILDYLIEKKGCVKFYLDEDFFSYLVFEYKSLFLDRFDDIQSLYLHIDNQNNHFDYRLKILKIILEIDPKFITKFLDNRVGDKKYLHKIDFLEKDFENLWSLKNCSVIFEEIIVFASNLPSFFLYTQAEVSVLFEGTGSKGIDILTNVAKKTNDEKILRLIFNIVVSVFNELKFDFLKILLNKNYTIEFFERLDFYTGSVVTTGSRIPKINSKIILYEELKNNIQKLNDIKYLPHLNFIENEIYSFKVELEWMRKREFLSEWSI